MRLNLRDGNVNVDLDVTVSWVYLINFYRDIYLEIILVFVINFNVLEFGCVAIRSVPLFAPLQWSNFGYVSFEATTKYGLPLIMMPVAYEQPKSWPYARNECMFRRRLYLFQR